MAHQLKFARSVAYVKIAMTIALLCHTKGVLTDESIDAGGGNMKLESQVCSLELAKRLKELGVKQESYFAWFSLRGCRWELLDRLINTQFQVWKLDAEVCAAFTVAELGEILPASFDLHKKYISGNLALLKIVRTSGRWILLYESHHLHFESGGTSGMPGASSSSLYSETPEFIDENEANCRAKMLIYLIEQGIVRP